MAAISASGPPATVAELTALYGQVMFGPVPGPDVCRTCLTFTEGEELCRNCATTQPWLDAVVPISYSVAFGQLHHTLVGYKRLSGPVAHRMQLQLAAILWRFLDRHERCIAGRARVPGFDVVTAVPSRRPPEPAVVEAPHGANSPAGERRPAPVLPPAAEGPPAPAHPLQRIVATLCGATRERHRPLLARADAEVPDHAFAAERFTAAERLDARSVLLIDDTWTTGANAQSAAAVLKRAGARRVALVVIGRHVKREWRGNEQRIEALRRPYDWSACACCTSVASLASAGICRRQ